MFPFRAKSNAINFCLKKRKNTEQEGSKEENFKKRVIKRRMNV